MKYESQNQTFYLVPERKLLIFPISASGANFSPQNTSCIPAVKICAFVELEKIFWFSFEHYSHLNGITPLKGGLSTRNNGCVKKYGDGRAGEKVRYA